VANVNEELVVAGVVRTLAEQAWPSNSPMVERAVSGAVRAYFSGASVTEACRVGQLLIAHPAPELADAASGPPPGSHGMA
jgi:hypothetical protein